MWVWGYLKNDTFSVSTQLEGRITQQQLVRDLLLKSSEMSLLCSLFLCFMTCVMCSLARLSPWYSYYIAVGNLLTNTFTHHATLLETLIFHEQTCRSTYGSLWLDCRTYNAGQALGKTKTTTCCPSTNTVLLQQLSTYEKMEPRTTSSPW